jgi:hypothetical protein
MRSTNSIKQLPTICFVLAAKDLGLYADMAAVAALAVRRLHSQARIILVTDEPTARAIDHRRHALGNIASEIIVQSTGADDPIVSSRRLRTSLRQLVKGDYLYLDNDAIAMQPLDRRWPEGADLALAHDWNERRIPPAALPLIESLSARLDWGFTPDRYLNAGVILVRDAPGAQAFYSEWHRRWQQTLSLGIREDQWSLNSTIAAGVATVAILPDADNWATHPNNLLRGRARIFHFWASAYGGEIPTDTLLGYLIAQFRQEGALDEDAIARAARYNFPWMGDVGLKHLLASRLYVHAVAAAGPEITKRFFAPHYT